IEVTGPEITAGLGIDGLGGDADLVVASPHAALDEVPDAEFSRDLSDVHLCLPALVDKRAAARDHEQEIEVTQCGNNCLDEPVGKVVFLRSGTKRSEWKDRNGRIRSTCGARSAVIACRSRARLLLERGDGSGRQAEHPNRVDDILEGPVSKVFQLQRE